MTTAPVVFGRTLVYLRPDRPPFVSLDPIEVAATRYRPEDGSRLVDLTTPKDAPDDLD